MTRKNSRAWRMGLVSRQAKVFSYAIPTNLTSARSTTWSLWSRVSQPIIMLPWRVQLAQARLSASWQPHSGGFTTTTRDRKTRVMLRESKWYIARERTRSWIKSRRSLQRHLTVQDAWPSPPETTSAWIQSSSQSTRVKIWTLRARREPTLHVATTTRPGWLRKTISSHSKILIARGHTNTKWTRTRFLTPRWPSKIFSRHTKGSGCAHTTTRKWGFKRQMSYSCRITTF